MKFKRITALLLAVTLLCGMVFAASFSDTETHWSSEYIEDMYAQGYVKGYSDGTFKPENQLTNLEALVFVSRLCTRDSDTLNAAKELHNTCLLYTSSNLSKLWLSKSNIFDNSFICSCAHSSSKHSHKRFPILPVSPHLMQNGLSSR